MPTSSANPAGGPADPGPFQPSRFDLAPRHLPRLRYRTHPVRGERGPGEWHPERRRPAPGSLHRRIRPGLPLPDIADPRAPRITGHLFNLYVDDIWAGVFRGARAAACAAPHDPARSWSTGEPTPSGSWTSRPSPTRSCSPSSSTRSWATPTPDGSRGTIIRLQLRRAGRGPRHENSRIRVIDISDLAHPSLAAVWTSGTRAIEHNGYVVGDKLYVSHYEHGMTILDVYDADGPPADRFFRHVPFRTTTPRSTARGASIRSCRAERS